MTAPLQILFATDGSEGAAGAQAALAALNLPAGSEIHVLSIVTDPVLMTTPGDPTAFASLDLLAEIHQIERERLQKIHAEAREALERDGVRVHTALRDGRPVADILAAADELQPDLLVLGPVGLSRMEAFLLGSVARNVATRSGRPVWVARPPAQGFRHAIVAVDASEQSLHALAFATRFPFPAAATLEVVHVLRPLHAHHPLLGDPERFRDTVEEIHEARTGQAESLLRQAADRLRAEGFATETTIRTGDPATELGALAQEQAADLIIAGARGISALQGLLTGSVADRLLNQCPVSVLLVP